MDNGADRHVNERLGEGLGTTHLFLPSGTIDEDLCGTVERWRADHHARGPAIPTTSVHLVVFFLGGVVSPTLWRGLDLLAVHRAQ